MYQLQIYLLKEYVYSVVVSSVYPTVSCGQKALKLLDQMTSNVPFNLKIINI